MSQTCPGMDIPSPLTSVYPAHATYRWAYGIECSDRHTEIGGVDAQFKERKNESNTDHTHSRR